MVPRGPPSILQALGTMRRSGHNQFEFTAVMYRLDSGQAIDTVAAVVGKADLAADSPGRGRDRVQGSCPMPGKSAAVVTTILLALAQPVAAGNLNAVFGYRMLEAEVWEPMEGHQIIGFDFEHVLKAFHVTVGLHLSASSDEDSEGNLEYAMNIAELSFGFKKLWKAAATTRVLSTYSAEPILRKINPTWTARDSCRMLRCRATINGWPLSFSPGRSLLPPWLAGSTATRMRPSSTSARRTESSSNN
jgi:hypothetical protein